MLNAAVRALKAGREPELTGTLSVATEINLHAPALLPGDYCANVHQRLVIYKRLANSETPEALETMQEEIIDRFGPMPEAVKTLIETHRLRILGKPLGVARIDAGPESILLQFVPKPPIDAAKIIEQVQRRADCRFSGPDRVRISAALPDVTARVATVRDFLRELA
jgi:transcription-repair coupling factor (superfamily II helicase)